MAAEAKKQHDAVWQVYEIPPGCHSEQTFSASEESVLKRKDAAGKQNEFVVEYNPRFSAYERTRQKQSSQNGEFAQYMKNAIFRALSSQ